MFRGVKRRLARAKETGHRAGKPTQKAQNEDILVVSLLIMLCLHLCLCSSVVCVGRCKHPCFWLAGCCTITTLTIVVFTTVVALLLASAMHDTADGYRSALEQTPCTSTDAELVSYCMYRLRGHANDLDAKARVMAVCSWLLFAGIVLWSILMVVIDWLQQLPTLL